MNYNVTATPRFKRDIKQLSKKYHSIKNDLADLIEELEKNPEQGTSLGLRSFKIRLAIASKGKGKSGGARVITHIVIQELNVFLLTIYDKSEKENISDKELQDLLEQLPE